MSLQPLYTLLRRIIKDKLLYVIIFANLIVGYASFIIISQFISGEFTWDKYNTNYDRIYRLQLFMDQEGNTIKHTWSVTAGLSRKELTDFPEIEKIVLIHDVGDNNKSGVFLSVDKENEFLTRYGYFADQSVFDIFTFNFIEGNPSEALTQPYSIVLSKELATKLFQGSDALGKQVYGENKVAFTVTGIYEDLPHRSTWRPVYLLPMLSYTALTGDKTYERNYFGYSFYTYVLLKPGTDPKSIDNQIYDALKDFRKEHHPYLRPMSRLELDPFFDPAMYIALALVGFLSVLILVLTSINFINLQTASATNRFREIGIKKTLGFSKKKLWMQFMSESLATTFFAALAGLLLAQVVLPSLNNFLGSEVFPGLGDNKKLIFIILVVTFLTGILSGIHPAYVISSYNPAAALKQKFIGNESNGITLKKVLVTIQFSISVFILIVAFIIYRQTKYMLTKDLGFDSETTLFSNIVTDKKGSFEPLKQRLLEHREIKSACVSDYIPFILPGGDDLHWDGAEPDEKVFVRYSNVSYDFVPTFGLKMEKGRNFSKEYPADRQSCLINETTSRLFRWDDPIGRKIRIGKRDYEVIGVIKDYTVSSVYNPVEPHLYRLIPDSLIANGVYSVSFVKGREKEAMRIVKEEFTKFFPNDAFDFQNIQFLVENEEAVKAFMSLRKITGMIAFLTIIISSVGLFGLILFMTQRKMKEIGIRKVLGFSFGNLYVTLSSWFIKLLVISLVIAWPAAYYVYKVLPGSNKYGLQLWEFLLATIIIMLVAIATISFQIIKALKVKPVEILKDE
jgi:putative ABC transport system permease protein